MAATYTKLRDGWGVRSTEPVQPGQTVTVTTKAGQAKTETITKVLWQGVDKYHPGQRIWLCVVAPRQQRASGGGGRTNRDDGWRRNGCSECRRLGDWCPRCAFDEFDN